MTGTIHSADAVAVLAQSELTAAYNAAAGTASTGNWNTDLGGHTFFAGVYTASSSLGLTGTVTLDAQNNSNAQFIFQIGSTLTAATGSNVNLINGALPANVFWQVGTSATVNAGASFSGNILALSSITLGTNATLQGRALARNGAVTMAGTDTITTPATLGGTGGGPPAPGGGSGGGSSAPAPSSLILVAIALVCAGIYGARKRLPKLLGRN